jgi:hypothetical protein
MPTIKPFQNEEDSFLIGDLTVENRLDRINLYGSLDITRDKEGLALAKQLSQLLDATLAILQSEQLPDHVAIKSTDNVDNPFK